MKNSKNSFLRCYTLLIQFLLFSCLSSPATRQSLEQAYKDGDASYLARAAAGKVRTDNDKTREYASSLYRKLRKEEIRKEIMDRKVRKDAAGLERMLEKSNDPFFEDDLRALALGIVKELRKAERLAEVEDANSREDIETLRRISKDTTDPYRTPDVRAKAASYEKALEAKLAARERERRLTAASARLDKAFDQADTVYLESASLGKDPGDPAFLDEPVLRKKASVLLAVSRDLDSSIRRLRSAPLDPRVRSVHPMITSFISTSPERYIAPLVESLLKNVYDPFEKVKLLHDWIADNIRYDFEGYLSRNLGDNSWAGVLKNKKSVCAGYANLFDAMCGIAGIPCEVVSGFAKGYGYDPLGSVRPSSNHAWNAVTIQGRKYLVDATWDSGYINAFNQNVKSYSTDYLFADPARIIYSHFPDDPRYQLLATPKTFEDFRTLPGLRGAYFDLGITVVSPELRGVMDASAPFELELDCPESVVLSASLRDMKDQRIDNACMVVREGRRARIRVAFPDSGPFTFIVFGGPWKERSLDLEGLLEIVLVNRGPAIEPPAYPTFSQDYFQNHCELLEPITGTLKQGEEYTFRLRAPGSSRVVFILDGKFIPLERNSAGEHAATLRVPVSKELSIFIQDPSRGYSGIVRYGVK